MPRRWVILFKTDSNSRVLPTMEHHGTAFNTFLISFALCLISEAAGLCIYEKVKIYDSVCVLEGFGEFSL